MTPEEPTLASALALGGLRSPFQENKDQNPEIGHQLSRGKAWEMTTDFHGPLFEGNPVGEGTTRRGTATPVHRPQRPAGSTHSSATAEPMCRKY